MTKKYGGMFSLKLETGTAVVLTDRRIIKELVDKKSSVPSNRPDSYVAQGIITGGGHLLVMKYRPTWRLFRKLIHQYFMEAMCEKEHIKVQNAEAVQMLQDFVMTPEHHMLHPKRFSNSVIMTLLFGTRTPSYDTPHMARLYDLMENWSKIMETGATPPVDVYPFLRLIPERFLGNWVSRATKVKEEMESLYSDMINHVIRRREQQGSKGSFMDKVLDRNDKLGLSSHELYFLGGVMMEGGSDTSSSIIIACIQVLTKWPEVQKKAQAEIDAVIGEDRSPLWSKYTKLPYVAAVVKEAMRWRPTKFPNPDIFDPAHYAGHTQLAPEYAASADYENRDHYGYGAGRRLCPGIHLGERNLFLGIAKLPWAFSFDKELDSSGKPIEPDVDPITGYSEGFLVCANPFPCKITPRSEARRDTIMKEFAQA
ncbi:Cytochrome P450 [Rasamsonia emersonii CBS 393.64]|uniref:Cytochrome P450 n=1 Tax=Rasamsonia emersonii (strain ATCC 16479 / CBS 393.64 / IMI 116815) TaxID=1408163 RepID=A0A0F4YPP4_RASE3|nr:Cytochrome P450 [Rasamsonia emersonii CBS 393.64]KKA19811.1 Cytochrome P450 [Rasamsonia emersonii CBS 393.64]